MTDLSSFRSPHPVMPLIFISSRAIPSNNVVCLCVDSCFSCLQVSVTFIANSFVHEHLNLLQDIAVRVKRPLQVGVDGLPKGSQLFIHPSYPGAFATYIHGILCTEFQTLLWFQSCSTVHPFLDVFVGGCIYMT